MPQEPRIISFTIAGSFDTSLRMLRRALEAEGLSVPCEVNVSGRIRKELGVGLRESIVLYVDAPILLLEATLLTAEGSLFIPVPVALSSNGDTCTVVTRSVRHFLQDSTLPPSLREPVLTLHERILSAIQSVGLREPVLKGSIPRDAMRV